MVFIRRIFVYNIGPCWKVKSSSRVHKRHTPPNTSLVGETILVYSKNKTILTFYCIFCTFFIFFARFRNKTSGLFNGYLCFVCSIAMIGICTAVIGDVAAQLGCFIRLKDSVNAIAFVALGTSVPGTNQYNYWSTFFWQFGLWYFFIGL